MAAARKLLVVLFEEGHEAQLRGALAKCGDEKPLVHVVAPAHISVAQWLATDEDEARINAERRVLQTERALRGRANVEGEAGDSDPVVAAEDALRTFPADEIMLVGGSAQNGGVERSLRQLGVPVTRIAAGTDHVRSRRRLREVFRTFARGESRSTPFAAIGGVSLALFAVVAMIIVIVMLLLLGLSLI